MESSTGTYSNIIGAMTQKQPPHLSHLYHLGFHEWYALISFFY